MSDDAVSAGEAGAAAPDVAPGGRAGLIAVALSLLALAAWRATLGFSLFDDSYYAVSTIRLAQGARLFVDEKILNSTGVMLAAPFAKLWLLAFGTSGIVLALRLLYVVVSAAVGVGVFRCLRPSFGRWAAFAPAAALALVPPYNILGVSYNTVAILGLGLATALSLKAVRDGSRWAAAGVGACVVVAASAYPPLVIAGVVLLATCSWLRRDRAVVLGLAAGAAVAAAVIAVVVLTGASFGDMLETYQRHSQMVSSFGRLALSAIGAVWHNFFVSMTRRWLVPMWAWFLPAAAAAIVAALRSTPARIRAWTVALLPLAVALPAAVRWFMHSDVRNVATLGGNYLVALTLFLAPPVFAWGLRCANEDVRRLLTLAAPAGVVGWATVLFISSASLVWASPMVGLAPLAAALLASGVELVREEAGEGASAGMTVVVCAVLVAMLFSLVYQDGYVRSLTYRFASGPLAGIATTPKRGVESAATGAVARRWVKPDDTVLFLGNPGGYLLVGGRPLTDATWIGLGIPGLGPVDQGTVSYFAGRSTAPDVVFITTSLLKRSGGFESAAKSSPLIAYVARGYRLAETTPGMLVLTRR